MLELGLLVVLLMLRPVLLIAFLGQAIVGIFLLEYVNYIQHYGLRRTGKERKTKMHSWQSERRWSSWTLLNLNLHPRITSRRAFRTGRRSRWTVRPPCPAATTDASGSQ